MLEDSVAEPAEGEPAAASIRRRRAISCSMDDKAEDVDAEVEVDDPGPEDEEPRESFRFCLKQEE